MICSVDAENTIDAAAAGAGLSSAVGAFDVVDELVWLGCSVDSALGAQPVIATAAILRPMRSDVARRETVIRTAYREHSFASLIYSMRSLIVVGVPAKQVGTVSEE